MLRTNIHATRSFRFGHGVGLVVAAISILAISQLPAGIGTHGRTSDESGGGTFSGSLNPDFSVLVDPNNPTTGAAVRDLIVVEINNDPNFINFTAQAATFPGDPNAAAFEVLRANGQDVRRLAVCETDPNFQNAGVYLSSGRGLGFVNKPVVVIGDGIYRLQVTMPGDPAWDFDQTFSTAAFAGDPNGLVDAIAASLSSHGFTTANLTAPGCGDFGPGSPGSGCLQISDPGGSFNSIRVEVTDTGIPISCVSLVAIDSPGPFAAIPTLSQYGMFLLVLMLTLAAIVVLRRKIAISR